MIHLLLSTLAMMGLTFLIGFFVAAVIKLIAYAADSFDFYSSHRLELLRLRRWRQHRQKVERLVRQIPIADEDALGDFREDYSKGIDRNFTGYSGYYHGDLFSGVGSFQIFYGFRSSPTHDRLLLCRINLSFRGFLSDGTNALVLESCTLHSSRCTRHTCFCEIEFYGSQYGGYQTGIYNPLDTSTYLFYSKYMGLQEETEI